MDIFFLDEPELSIVNNESFFLVLLKYKDRVTTIQSHIFVI